MNTVQHIKICELCKMTSTHSDIDTRGKMHSFCDHHSLQDISKKSDSTLKKLLPLFTVFLIIFLLASVRQIATGIDSVLFMMDFMGIFFIVFGFFKIIDLRGFVDGFQQYDFLAKKFRVYGYLYPFIEIGLGILYILGFMFLFQNIAVLLFSLIGLYTTYLSIVTKNEAPCLCLGTRFALPMTWVTFLENLIMFIMGIFMILM